MKLKLLIVFILSFYFTANAQDTPQDTLQTISNPVMQADSTAQEEEGDEEENTEEEEEKDDTPAKFRYSFSTDGTVTSGNVNRALIQFATSLDWNLHKTFK